MYEKEPLCNETFRYSLQILPVPFDPSLYQGSTVKKHSGIDH